MLLQKDSWHNWLPLIVPESAWDRPELLNQIAEMQLSTSKTCHFVDGQFFKLTSGHLALCNIENTWASGVEGES